VERTALPKTRREFRFRGRTLAVYVVMFGLMSVVPIMSLHELFTTGTINWTAGGEGRRSYPSWIAYPLGWAMMLYFPRLYFPLFKYLKHPLMFALDDQAIEIGGERIPREQVISILPRSRHADVLVETERGGYSIRPFQVAGGVSALQEAFPDKFDPKFLRDAPAWLVGR
jgi:hypothetical protein